MISHEKSKLTFTKNVDDLGKIIVARGFKKLPKVQQIAQSGHTATIAPWFCLCLPSCDSWFESQAHHLRFFEFVLLKLEWEEDKNKQKRGWRWPIFKTRFD